MSDGFALIVSAIRVWHNQGYSKAAVLTLLICDILHNLADEVKYIWRSKWTFVKTMYLLARYYGVALDANEWASNSCLYPKMAINGISLHTQAFFTILPKGSPLTPRKFCRRYIRVISMLGDVYFVIIDIICIIRVYALWERSNKAYALHISSQPVEIALAFYASWHATEFKGAPNPPKNELSDRYGCGFLLAPFTGSSALVIYIASCNYPALFFVLSVIRIRYHLRGGLEAPKSGLWKGSSYASPMARAFMKDGALGFLHNQTDCTHALSVIHSLCASMNFYRDGFYFPPTWPWQYAVSSYAGSRLILSLRRAEAPSRQTEDGGTLPLRFAPRRQNEAYTGEIGSA
ncbi:hypothetical protein DFP72DRAFT_897436 [Ephemerocybe angulata]|uniref:DUF6533 domain-containing protein n=1 Tax=Ephemerocybe angulata TaxID=980116 RepID=A0A8H6HZA3_9AGAR|nr:hypothetical protein DFP72DRAFT_897436 [Tulosesus angulatus]